MAQRGDGGLAVSARQSDPNTVTEGLMRTRHPIDAAASTADVEPCGLLTTEEIPEALFGAEWVP